MCYSLCECVGDGREAERNRKQWLEKTKWKWTKREQATGGKKWSNNKKSAVERRDNSSSSTSSGSSKTQLENVRDNFIYYPFSIWFHFALAISGSICCCNQTQSIACSVHFHMFVISHLTRFEWCRCCCCFSVCFFLSLSLDPYSAVVISLFVGFMSWFTLPVTPFHNLSYTLSNIFDWNSTTKRWEAGKKQHAVAQGGECKRKHALHISIFHF